jgi:hypothetical protein
MFWRILVSVAVGEVLVCVLPLLMAGARMLLGLWLLS